MCQWLYPVAALGGAGSMLATSFKQPNAIWQLFLAQSAVFGLLVAYGVQPALTVMGQYFKRWRALAMGIVASGSSVGGVCLPIMFSRLIPRSGFTGPCVWVRWSCCPAMHSPWLYRGRAMVPGR